MVFFSARFAAEQSEKSSRLFYGYAQASGGDMAFPARRTPSSGNEDNSVFSSVDTGKIYRDITTNGGVSNAAYGFYNFNHDFLNITYRISASKLAEYFSSFGYSDDDLVKLAQKRKELQQIAYKYVVANKMSQADLDSAGQVIDSGFQDSVTKMLQDRGFKLKDGRVIAVNVPQIVKNFYPSMKPVAKSFAQIAQSMDYSAEDLVGGILSLAQTGVEYRLPPEKIGGKYTGGILLPPQTMAYGWGDCDTKTALVSAILLNWKDMPIVGVSLPGHYLMAVQASPRHGDVFITYQGKRYILMEPAGPGWFPPGVVGKNTMIKLQAQDGLKIEPFYL